MKIGSLVFLVGLLIAAIVITVRFFLERKRQQKIDAEGVVVYATFLSSEPVKFLGKPQGDMAKITLRVQEPGATEPREVSLKTRTDPRQQMVPGMKVAVVIDPKDSSRVYPASPEAQKRAVATGSRLERRIMQSQMRTPGRTGPQPPSGYMPPTSALGGRGKRR